MLYNNEKWKMDFMPYLWLQNQTKNQRWYSSWKLPVILPEMQAWNTDWSSSTEYIRYQRARRTDAEPITHKAILLVVIGFFLFQYATTACPARRGKKKTVAGQVAFVRSFYISIQRRFWKIIQGRRSLCPYENDALTLTESAAHGGSRHEAKSVST